MTTLSTTARFDRAFFETLADWLAVGVALALPWSTTATGICIVAWLLTVLPTLDAAAVKREVVTAAGGLPLLLWCLGFVGMLWADVSWTARLGGLDGFNRLLMIPLLLAQFRRSEHGIWVIYGFLVSSAVVLVVSLVMIATPGPMWRHHVYGVPVHDDIFQSSAFLICGFGALGAAAIASSRRVWPVALAFVSIGALFLADFAFAVFSRAVLLVAPVLAALLGWRELRWKGLLAAGVLVGAIGLGAWFASPNVRLRIGNSIQEIQDSRVSSDPTSLREHAAFLKESLAIIASAPIIGHGTGSIADQFRQVTAGNTGANAVATINPHNQTFAVAIQLGLVGAILLWAMWIAHLLLFRGESFATWLGTVVVVENVVSSTVHSHLFDFNNGWLYVFGVGVLGGMALREREARP